MKQKNKNWNKASQVGSVLLATILLIMMLLARDIHKAASEYFWENSLDSCLQIQDKLLERLAENAKSSNFKLTLGEIRNGNVLNDQKLSTMTYQCPYGGVLRVEPLDLSGAMIVECSVHGAKDRKSNRFGMIKHEANNSTIVYPAKIRRHEIDSMTNFFIGVGILAGRRESIKLSLLKENLIISFRINQEAANNKKYISSMGFYAGEMEKEIFPDRKIEFRLYEPGKKIPLIINKSSYSETTPE